MVEALIELLASFGDGLDDDVAILAIGIPPAPRRVVNTLLTRVRG